MKKHVAERLIEAFWRSVLTTLLVFCAASTARPQRDVTLSVEQVKAAFLYNFTKYTQWPSHREGHPGTLLICALEAGEVAGELERTIEGKTSGTNTVKIRRIREPAGAHGCDLVFVGEIGREEERRFLSAVSGLPVVTVGDSETFLSAGMIRFVLADNRIRFDMNLVAAEKANIRFDSRLIALARRRLEVTQ